ncbi:MAG: zinc-binding dehydrogenase [Ilumatobacter sp.]
MRALTFVGPAQLEWRDVAEPAIADECDVLVRPLAVARCDLDLPIAIGLYPMPAPFVMGHEMVGEIVDVGPGVEQWSVGDRVIVPFQISCGACPMCVRGLTNACAAVPSGSAFGFGSRGGVDFGGALAELVRVPFADHLLLALPDAMSPERGAGVPDNVSDGYRCVAAPLAALPGASVLVVGGLAQSVGLYAVAAAIALGADRVHYVDQDDTRLEAAEMLGATVERCGLDQLVATERYPITVDACALDQGRVHALRSTSPCGHCTSVSGGVSPQAGLPLQSMYLKGVTYDIGRVHGRATAPAVLELMSGGMLDPLAVPHRVVHLDDAAEAMMEPDVKIIFTNDPTAVH